MNIAHVTVCVIVFWRQKNSRIVDASLPSKLMNGISFFKTSHYQDDSDERELKCELQASDKRSPH